MSKDWMRRTAPWIIVLVALACQVFGYIGLAIVAMLLAIFLVIQGDTRG